MITAATSPLGEVATFGLFTALLVAANYIFVITYFPAVLIIYHMNYESTPGCCCYKSVCCYARKIPPAKPYVPQGTISVAEPAHEPEKAEATGEMVGDAKAVEAVEEKPKPMKVEVLCTEKFAPIVASPARFAFVAFVSSHGICRCVWFAGRF